jgi:hypothetical protein
VALTGAVRGQQATPAPHGEAEEPAATPAAAREVKAAPATAAPAAAPATATPTQRQRPEQIADEDVDAAVVAQLKRTIEEVNFEGAGLSDVIDFLRDVSGSNLVVEWGALQNAGLDRNTPVTLRVRGVSFGHALELVLSSAGGGSVPIEYAIDRNVIRISTAEDLDRVTEVRAYDVRDIVPNEMPMAELATLIREAVAPDSWRDAGGSVGAIHSSKHKLIVTQNPMNHLEIKAILQMLREEPREPARATDAASAAQGTPQPQGRQ